MAENKHRKYNNPVSATLTGIGDLFKKQVPAGVLKLTDRLDGKTVLVDGSSSGLGFAIAVDVARRGAKVIMACRSGIPEMGEKVKKLSGNQNVHMLHVDFSDINSIHSLIAQLRPPSPPGEGSGGEVVSSQGEGSGGEVASHAGDGPIDILICNAGIVPKKSRKTPQGLEEMFMVNYFSKFIFVNLLLENNCFRNQPNDILNRKSKIENRKSNIPRIIFIASESHRNPEKFDWDDFGKYRDYSIGKSIELYGYYKLLLTTFSVELSRRLNPNGQTNFSVFSMCPGPVNSNIAREAPKAFTPLLKLVFGIFFKSPAKAAIPVVYLAASGDVEGKAFDYLFLMSRQKVDEKASDPENGRRLWELSAELRENLN
ncbi:MAG: SDR family NAD(P)-dependent oxidoreductase [Bacteroidetes bacterium]|nr:SDR family NAD(P)-dependent oxidoreductase [Bacteroidota bacterium]